MDRISRQKLTKKKAEWNHILGQIDPVDTQRMFPPSVSELTFSIAHESFSRKDHGLG